MDELCLGNGEGETPGRRNVTQGAEVALKKLNIASLRRGRNRDHEIIHIGDYYDVGDHRV